MAEIAVRKECMNRCMYVKEDNLGPEHECTLLPGHNGPCSFPCVNIHILENASIDLAMLMNKFAEMQREPFSLHVEKTTPEQREWWTNFLEALRLVSRELGAVTAGGPKYRMDAAIAWLREIYHNIPEGKSGLQILDNFVDNTGSTKRSGEMLLACASFFQT